jgi:hypothetical protein
VNLPLLEGAKEECLSWERSGKRREKNGHTLFVYIQPSKRHITVTNVTISPLSISVDRSQISFGASALPRRGVAGRPRRR